MNESSIIIISVYVRNSVICVVVVLREENKAFLRRSILDTVAEAKYIRYMFL